MGDAIHLEQGCPPWHPSDTSEDLHYVHEWDVPVIGTLKQDGHHYVFWCVVGHAAPSNVWAYARVETDASEALESAEDLPRVLRELVDGRTCTFALASDDEGIREFATLDPPASFDDVYMRGMTALASKISDVLEEYQEFQRRMASVQDISRFHLAPSGLPEDVSANR